MDLWVKVLHIVAVISWMAGLLYLPRLIVYHVEAATGGDLGETLKIMEMRLYRYIMTPAMVVTWASGGLLAWWYEVFWQPWFWVKLVAVVAMTGFHHVLNRWRLDFARDANARPQRFYRIANEIPTVLMIVIVIMVVLKPF